MATTVQRGHFFNKFQSSRIVTECHKMNRDLALMQEAQALSISLEGDLVVKNCSSGAIAIDTTCVVSGYSKETLAERIGKAREVLSRASSGRGGLDVDVLVKLMQESGSALIIQYMAKRLGGEFRFLTNDEIEIQKTEAYLASLKAKRIA